MLENIDMQARRALFFARYEASRLGSPVLEPEHLMLGLLRATPRRTEDFLERHPEMAPLTVNRQRNGLWRLLFPQKTFSTSVSLPPSEGLKRIFKRADEEASRAASQQVRPEELLQAFLLEQES